MKSGSLWAAKIILLLQLSFLFVRSHDDIEDWAVKISGGSKIADIVAEKHGFKNLGPILPDSDLYHFNGVRSHRLKREAENRVSLEDSVSWSEKQKVVKRVKRQNFAAPRPRSSFREIRPIKRKDSLCSINTIPTENKPSQRCVFPFIYKENIYGECTTDHSINGKEWCATEVSPEGAVLNGHWGDCDSNSFRCHDFEKILSPTFSFLSPFNNLFDLFPTRSGNRPPLLVEEPTRKPQEVKQNLSSLKTTWNDEYWGDMWFLNRGGDHLDMNVENAWNRGYSGKNVVVTILDDGVEWDHPDLRDNYDSKASIDLNDRDPDPFPRYDLLNSNKHGTRCAGQVAAVGNNSLCSVGVAYNAKVGGIRILDGRIFDSLEAQALSYNRDYIDVYSASWGPDDNGATVDGPGTLAKQALKDGVTKGRKGKGSIFVWASGNGGKKHDDCNCDGYSTSIHTLSVSSTSENGLIPWYSEPCASSLATTFSSGASNRRLRESKIVTTDLRGECTKSHTGTSASSPMAAAIIALALEANPKMTWRDVQHLVVQSARGSAGNFLKADDWNVNGVGREFSHSYGFGLMDADAMVRLAENWTSVSEQVVCISDEVLFEKGLIGEPNSEIVSSTNGSSCIGKIDSIEHIHLHINLESNSRRGDLSVSLTSPSGTTSRLLGTRPFDDAREGFSSFLSWPMMSVHFWGENVAKNGTSEWTLKVHNYGDGTINLTRWRIVFYGTSSSSR